MSVENQPLDVIHFVLLLVQSILQVKRFISPKIVLHDLNPTSQLTGDDLQILIDLIEENLMEEKGC